jgi:hypothetical protein
MVKFVTPFKSPLAFYVGGLMPSNPAASALLTAKDLTPLVSVKKNMIYFLITS